MAKIYGEVADKVLEIQNWRERASGDAVVMQRLNDADAARFRELRAQGLNDRQIWDALHAETAVEGNTLRLLEPTPFPQAAPRSETAEPLRYRFDELPQEQLIWMIERVMGQRAESLAKLDRCDLLSLARFATRGREVELSFHR